MSQHDDFTFEPIPGLPERPPQGEDILWQGRPDTLALAREAMGLTWVAGYMVIIALWRAGAAATYMPPVKAAAVALPYLALGLLACLVILAIAWAQARTTVYTITTARVAMRIGAALNVTLNIPFRKIANADLQLRKSGHGTISLETLGETKFFYLVLWPHCRPGHIRVTKPALRCIPDAQKIARLLADAAEARVSQPVVTRAPAPAGALLAAE